jgi:DNA-binding response OmpR family regulator
MPRPTLLVAEPEPDQALSVRKLVLETGKFNVLTAHSTREAVELFHLFPNISAAIIATGNDMDCDEIGKTIKSFSEKVPVICLSPLIGAKSSFADRTLSSHEPEELLNAMRSMFGDPRQQDNEC